MSQIAERDCDLLLKRLFERSSSAKKNIEDNIRNTMLKDTLIKEKQRMVRRRVDIEKMSSVLKATNKILAGYVADKKKKSMKGIYSGIYSAQTIIPDTTTVKLHVDAREAFLINDEGDDVNLVEGSAFRATLSFFMRGIILKNTNYIPFMVLDEPLTTLSEESSAALSNFLPIIANDMQIILIEQKDAVFSNSDEIVYEFKKSEGETRVRRL